MCIFTASAPRPINYINCNMTKKRRKKEEEKKGSPLVTNIISVSLQLGFENMPFYLNVSVTDQTIEFFNTGHIFFYYLYCLFNAILA